MTNKRKLKINSLKFLTLLILTGFISISNKVLANQVLSVGAIPDQNPERLNRLYNLLAKELSKGLNVDIKYIPVINYSAAVSAFRTGDLDLVWFGGLTGVQARIQRPGAKVIAQRDIDANFTSVFIANTSAKIPKIKSIDDLKFLKGKRFTFGSESSTSGRLMPQYFLNKAGVKITDFKGRRPGFSGSHDTTIALVQSGSYEAGALNKEVWRRSFLAGRIKLEKVKVIWETPRYADYHWLVQPNLDKRFGQGFTNKIRHTILSFSKNDKRQKEILDLFGAKKFIKADESQYITIEKVARMLGKIQ